MSNVQRLIDAVAQLRQRSGDVIFNAPDLVIAQLAAQAPDLNAEVQVLARAIAQNVQQRLTTSPNAQAELASLSAYYAAQTGASVPAAQTALQAVWMMPPLGNPGANPATATPGAAVPFYEQGILKKTWVRVVLGLMAFGLIFNLLTGKFQRPAAPVVPAGTQDPGGYNPQQPPQQGG